MLQLGNKITVGGEPIYKFQNNHSVDFDGVDDFIQLGEPISYTQHTISTWVKSNDDSSTKIIFDSRDSSTDGIRIRTNNSQAIIYNLNDSELTSSTTHAGEWVHIVGTYDGTTQKLYINGSLNQSATTTQAVSVTTNAKIGTRNFSTPDIHFVGKIDELAIYDRVLTAAEVTEIYRVASNLKLNSGNYKSADPVIVSTKSVDLDGGEEYLEVQDDASLRGLSNLSISTWVKLSSKGAFDKIIDYSGAEGNVNRKYRLMLNTDANRFQFLIGDASDTVYTVTSTTDPDLNRWYNVICTFQGSGSNRLKIYVNGVLEASGSGADSVAEISNTADGNLRFGSNSYSVANLFHGKLDELGIFNTALTSDQVGELYNQGVPSNLATSSAGVDGTLIGYWKMGDGTLDEAPLIADQTNATLGSELVTDGGFTDASNWDLTGTATVSGGTGNFPNADGSFIIQDNVIPASVKVYKLEYEVVESNNGNLRLSGGASAFGTVALNSSIGVHSIFLTSNGSQDNLQFNNQSSFIGKIDNVSVKQVNGNPALMQNTPTIVTDAPLTKIRNYYRMGDGILDEIQGDGSILHSTNGVICDMIEPSLGAELITDGDFPLGTSAWTLDTGWELKAGACERSGHGSNTDFKQSISITANKLYKVSYTRVYESGHKTTNLFSDFETDGSNITLGSYGGDDVTIKINSYFMPTYTGSVFVRVFGINDWAGKITNVSVKEVNGVAGKMTNMRDTDITNDVPS